MAFQDLSLNTARSAECVSSFKFTPRRAIDAPRSQHRQTVARHAISGGRHPQRDPHHAHATWPAPTTSKLD
jgi:hypothetical protein